MLKCTAVPDLAFCEFCTWENKESLFTYTFQILKEEYKKFPQKAIFLVIY